MQIRSVIEALEKLAPSFLQEDYDNCGLLTGRAEWECTGILIALDITEAVLEEAHKKGSNLVIAHHPLLFKGLKRINGNGPVERCVIRAIQLNLAIFAIHTSLDNRIEGVNSKLADKLFLTDRSILSPKNDLLRKLVFFVPPGHAESVRQAIFNAGGGHIGNYSECSFYHPGTGTFRPDSGATPFTGNIGTRSLEQEERVEILYPVWLEKQIIQAMKAAHPYEEVAYDLLSLNNLHEHVGSGIIGTLPEPLEEKEFLQLLKEAFGLSVIRHTAFRSKPVQKIAVCGGAGSFLMPVAMSRKADAFITSDLKYHEFFEPDGQMLLADIGHWESEQFTTELLYGYLKEKFPTFAVLQTGVITNPVHYFL
jgi:dinuclear metal center YbgI/SA1388 family protein